MSNLILPPTRQLQIGNMGAVTNFAIPDIPPSIMKAVFMVFFVKNSSGPWNLEFKIGDSGGLRSTQYYGTSTWQDTANTNSVNNLTTSHQAAWQAQTASSQLQGKIEVELMQNAGTWFRYLITSSIGDYVNARYFDATSVGQTATGRITQAELSVSGVATPFSQGSVFAQYSY